jgi:hypothetical protein
LGLVAGVGWWSLPEISYYLLPAGLIVIGAIVQSVGTRSTVQWCVRLGLGVAAFVIGALPWLWANVNSGLASLDSSKFPGTVTPLNPGYSGRLRLFFRFSLPIYTNLRRLDTGEWIVGTGTSTLHRLLLVGIVGVVAVVVIGALILCFLKGGRAIAVAVALLAFPFLVAVQPGTWFWQWGRYTVYLGSLLALTIGIGADELGRRIRQRRRSMASGAPVVFGARLFMSIIVVVSVALTVVQFQRSFAVNAHDVVSGWANPDRATEETASALEARGIRSGYADYWVAYKLDFLSRGKLALTVAGSDPDRWLELNHRVTQSHTPAWLFVTPGHLDAGLSQFAETMEIVGPSGQTRMEFIAALDRLGIPYRTMTVGPLDVVIPSQPVEQHPNGQIVAVAP